MAAVDPTHSAQALPGHEIARLTRRERLAYTATTTAVLLGPHLVHSGWAELGAAGVLVWKGADLIHQVAPHHEPAGNSKKSKKNPTPPPDDNAHLNLLGASQRALPVLGFSSLYLAQCLPHAPWWEALLAAGWGLLMCRWTPRVRSRGFITAPAAATPTGPTPSVPAATLPHTYTQALSWKWEVSGRAPGTRLVHVEQLAPGARDFRAIALALVGRAVPQLPARDLAAIFDLPEGSVRMTSLSGSGPGRMLVEGRPDLGWAETRKPRTIEQLWKQQIDCPGGAAPGMRYVDHRQVDDNSIMIRVRAAEGSLISLPQAKIARAFGITDTELLVVETDGLADGLVCWYRTHPLKDVREATKADLTMDEHGRIQLGVQHDGRAGRIPLWDPQLGAVTDLFVGAPGAGKSVTLNTILAAERISGVVSIVADAQDGMSLPEANGRTYHFGAGIAATAATLAAAYAVAKYRQKVSAANGWGTFELNDPWRLANITLDELNLILAADADVPKEFRKWVVGLVAAFQSTGRKFGMGIRFAAQSIHLEDLGDKDKIRGNAKNGTVGLGRTNSSTTLHMARDGVVPPGVEIEPIPRYFNSGSRIDAAYRGDEMDAGLTTAGMMWIIQGGRVFKMRVFRAVKKNRTFPGLIDLYESEPIPRLSPEEDETFQRTYQVALERALELLNGAEGAEDEDDLIADIPMPVSTQSLPDKVLGLLAEGPKSMKELRGGLPDYNAGSIGNAVSVLHGAGQVKPVRHGVWELV
jgi:hypothetical protein